MRLPGRELGLCKRVYSNPKQGKEINPTNATARMIVHKIRSSFICHSLLMGEHTNLMGEQYIIKHFNQSENKTFFGAPRRLKLYTSIHCHVNPVATAP